MALRYWITGGTGNYNSTTNWSASSGGASGASVPTTADDAVWDANSGAGTVAINVASVAKSINFTNFTGTVDFQNTLTVAGSMTLGIGMSFANTTGTPVLSVTATATLTSNGVAFPYDFSFSGSSATLTLADDWECQNFNLEVTATGTPSFIGNNFFINGNLSNLNTVRYIAGSTVFVMQGNGNITTYQTNGFTANNIVINTSGTITLETFSSNNYFGAGTTGTFTYTAGTVIISPGILLYLRATWDLNNLTFDNIYLASTINLLSDISCTDSITTPTSATTGPTINGIGAIRHIGLTGGLLNTAGNATSSITSYKLQGSATFIFEGSGTIDTGGVAGAVGVNLVVNTTGTYTLNPITALPGATFTYTAGTIDFSTVDIYCYSGGSLTLNGIGSLVFKKLQVAVGNAADSYFELNDTLNIDEIDFSAASTTNMGFTGTNPFICNTFKLPYRQGNTDKFLFQSSLTYTINSLFTNTTYSIYYKTAPVKISTTSVGVKSKIKLSPGASQELMFVDFTDIDASNGQTLWVFGSTATVTDCENINTFTQPKAVGF